MGRHVNKKCQQCSQLSVEEAIALHGEEGDGCWTPTTCHRRRSHYRHREDINRTRRRVRKASQSTRQATVTDAGSDLESSLASNPGSPPQPDSPFHPPSHEGRPEELPDIPPTIEVKLPAPSAKFSAVLVLYRQHKDAPVHAIAAEIWQLTRKVTEVKPIHCMGMRGNEVTSYIQEMLDQLNQKFGIVRFEDVIKEIPVERCPIVPCPLNGR